MTADHRSIRTTQHAVAWVARRQRTVAALLCACAPAAVLLGYGVEPFYVQNGVDPFIYAGYSFEMSDLVTRYGYPYFAVRFGLLAPSELFVSVFGASAGYLLLRWVLMSATAMLAYVWCRRVGRPGLALVAVPLWLINPIVFRSVLTMYSDSVGVPYVFAAFVLLLMPGERRTQLLASVGAGAAIGLAVHSNLFLAFPLGMALVAWFFVRVAHFRRDAIRDALLVVGAIAFVTVAGVILYRIRFGDGNIFRPSLDAVSSLTSTTAADRAPTHQWIDFRLYLWIPLIAVVGLLVALIARRARPTWYESSALAMSAAVGIAFLYEEFIRNGFLLETYYYTSYFFGPTVVLIVLAVRRICAGHAWSSSPWPFLCGLIMLAPFVWRQFFDDLELRALPTVPIVALAVGVAVWFGVRSTAVARAGASFLVLCPLAFSLLAPGDVPLEPGQTFRREPHYDASMFHEDHSVFDDYVLASKFMDFVPDWETSPGTVVFWYSERDELANLVGSTFQWKKTVIDPYTVGLPELAERSKVELAGRTPRYVVMISSEAALLDAGREELGSLLTPLNDTRRELRSGSARVFVELLEYEPASCDGASKGSQAYWDSLPVCSA